MLMQQRSMYMVDVGGCPRAFGLTLCAGFPKLRHSNIRGNRLRSSGEGSIIYAHRLYQTELLLAFRATRAEQMGGSASFKGGEVHNGLVNSLLRFQAPYRLVFLRSPFAYLSFWDIPLSCQNVVFVILGAWQFDFSGPWGQGAGIFAVCSSLRHVRPSVPSWSSELRRSLSIPY
jgi:hypothetical protein